MRVMILGGSGFIGQAIAQRAHQAGHELLLYNRRQRPSTHPFRTWPGDLADSAELGRALTEFRPEAVVHTMALGPDDGESIHALLKGRDTQLLVLSSMDLYAAFQDLVQSREGSDFPLREDAPLTEIPFYRRGVVPGPRSERYDKKQLARILLAATEAGELQASLYHLPMVWGPEDPQTMGRHGEILRRLRSPEAPFVMGVEAQNQIWTYGYVENVAAGIVHALGRRELAGRLYNLGEQQQRSRRRWAELYAEVAGLPLHVRLLPDAWLDAVPSEDDEASEATRAQAAEGPKPSPTPLHFIADSSAFARDTGFVEPVPLREALAANWAWAQGQDLDRLAPAPDHDREARWLKAYERFLQQPPA